ncbi:chromate transporter [Desertibacillus haloalkaliphilus]|uniref:chromate transporter n=1 Tax=Desertibacillus haloalkaliphilus TaxID=1328930 RepID=UPI001C25B68A|nr:chromate transporter [Desertibacillus haloalkaliphilus]MBU8908234.1 chromate transporter [Desertibacillus haloalkaliphilus]
MNVYLQLTIGLARSGVLGYGGGPSVIPLIEHEAVKKYNWMTSEEFGDTLALANTLPGPIATKMSAYIGYKVKGSMGAFVAILAHILPSIVAMIGLLSFLYSFRDSAIVSGMVQAVTPVVAVMLAVMAFSFLKKASNGLGTKGMLATALLCLILLELLVIHPGIVIVIFLTSAFAYATYLNRKKGRQETEEQRKDVGS